MSGEAAGALQAATPALILASGSAARRDLLAAAGLRFAVAPARIDEAAVKQAARAEAVPPEQTATLLAELKATRITARHPDAVVIGADQLLVCDGEVFDKPADLAAARRQLERLRGRRHSLFSAVLCVRNRVRLWDHCAWASLTMRSFSDEVLEAYLGLEAEHIERTVGSYRLEGPGVQLLEAVEGDYFAILGLPLLPLLGFLRQHGVLAS